MLAKAAPTLTPVVGVVVAMGFYFMAVAIVAFVGVFRKATRVLVAYLVLLVLAVGFMCYAIALFTGKQGSSECAAADLRGCFIAPAERGQRLRSSGGGMGESALQPWRFTCRRRPPLQSGATSTGSRTRTSAASRRP